MPGFHLQQLLLSLPQPRIDQMTRHHFNFHSQVMAFLVLGLQGVLNLKCTRLLILVQANVSLSTSRATPTS